MTGGHGSGLRARVHARFSGVGQPADERGFTLIEILIAVVLLGTMTVAMIGALYGIGYVSSQQRAISVAEAEGRRLVEQIRSLSYVPCATDDSEEIRTQRYPLVFESGNDHTSDLLSAEIIDIEYWAGEGIDPNGAGEPKFEDDCTQGDCGLQRITLSVTAEASTATFQFLKRSEVGDADCLE